MTMTLDNDTPSCDGLQDSSSVESPACVTNAPGGDQEHAGVSRRGGGAHGAVPGADDAPPQVIRGCKLQDSSTCIDWSGFNFPCSDGESPRQLADYLLTRLPQGATERKSGGYFYTHGFDLPGGGRLLYHPQRPEMGVSVSLPPGSLSLLDMSVKSMIAWVLTEGGHFTRLDIAVDSYSVTMAQVRAAMAPRVDAPHGDCVTKARESTGWNSLWEHKQGDTVYIGSRSSEAFVRFYNKAQEQGLDDGEVWTRCEVEYKGSQAQKVAIAILEGADLKALIVSVIDFRDRSADSNVSRCPRLDWWASWVGSVKRAVFPAMKRAAKTFAEVYEWLHKQVAPSLAFCDQYLKAHSHWLYELCDSNVWRIPVERKMQIHEMELGIT